MDSYKFHTIHTKVRIVNISANQTFYSNEHLKKSLVEKLMFQKCGKVSISLFNNSLCDGITPRIRKLWERELSVPIDEDICDKVWEKSKAISICNRMKAVQLKILHRLHISPNRRHVFNNSIFPFCLKCKTEIGTLTQCWTELWE